MAPAPLKTCAATSCMIQRETTRWAFSVGFKGQREFKTSYQHKSSRCPCVAAHCAERINYRPNRTAGCLLKKYSRLCITVIWLLCLRKSLSLDSHKPQHSLPEQGERNVTDRTPLHKTYVARVKRKRKPLVASIRQHQAAWHFSQTLALAFRRDGSQWHAIHHSHREALPLQGSHANMAGASFCILCGTIYPKDVLSSVRIDTGGRACMQIYSSCPSSSRRTTESLHHGVFIMWHMRGDVGMCI